MVKFLDKNSGFSQWNANQAASQKNAPKKSPFGGFLWWIVLFVASFWLINSFLSPKKNQVAETTDTVVAVDVSGVPTSEIKSDKISATVQGLRVSDIKLHEFAKNGAAGDDENAEPVSLLGAPDNFAEVGLLSTGTTAPGATTVWRAVDGANVWRNNDGVNFRRAYKTDGYVITITDEIKNNTKREISVAPYVRIVRDNDVKSSAGVYTGAVAFVNSDIEHQDWKDLDRKSYAYSTTNGFVGFADQYWESVAAINRPDQTIRVKKIGDKYQADAAAAAVVIAPGATETITTHIFAGPRNQEVLSTVATQIPGVNKTVDYGWFGFLARPMLWALNAINSVVMNYGVAIIIFTLLLRLLIWPLTRKSYTSMMAMQKMQPEMARIQKLYANDKPRMQMEMMRLYQTHKTSPMSGCLPMLIQIPIFFALYKALLISVPMRSAHFLWISDLAAMDPYFILPILMGATMWWQQHLQTAAGPKTSAPGDPVAQTQRVMKWMPIVFTVLFAFMPAGLVLYWTVSNLFAIGQMYIIKRRTAK